MSGLHSHAQHVATRLPPEQGSSDAKQVVMHRSPLGPGRREKCAARPMRKDAAKVIIVTEMPRSNQARMFLDGKKAQSYTGVPRSLTASPCERFRSPRYLSCGLRVKPSPVFRRGAASDRDSYRR